MKKYLILRLAIVIFSFPILVCSCAQDNPQNIASLENKFNQYYQEWKNETYLSVHSDTGWYISRPSFRKIVDFGMDTIPLIEEKIRKDKQNNWENGDFFLAYAVVEIYGWDTVDFYSPGKTIGEHGFCNNVLKRLEETKLKQ